MGNKNVSGKYETTNASFSEIFSGEYVVPGLNFAPATVLDLGANEGAFTAWALEEWPQAHIIAFEPIPENAALFRKNHGGNPRVRFSELAIAPESPVKMYYGLNNAGECSLTKGIEQTDKTVEVKAMPASELPCCELVKIDVECAELDIISNLNLVNTKVVVLEYHNWGDGEKITRILEKAGFESVEHRAHSFNQGVMKMARPEAISKKPYAGKPTKVYIGVPSFFHIDPHFHRCLLMTFGWLASQPDLPGAIHGEIAHSFGDSPNVGRTRNMITRQFLESDCTDLLFIDSDLVFSVDHVKRILSHPEEVVGGMYFKKCQGKPEACLNTIMNPIIKPNGLNQVAYIGTGFLRIKRVVFEEIIKRWGPEIAYCPDATRDILEYNFWNLAMHTFDDYAVDPERVQELVKKYGVTEEVANKAIRTRWLSEDWWFCQRCNDLGFKVWADRRIPLRHSGNALYPLETQEEEVFGRQLIYGSHAPASADADKSTSPLAPASA